MGSIRQQEKLNAEWLNAKNEDITCIIRAFQFFFLFLDSKEKLREIFTNPYVRVYSERI